MNGIFITAEIEGALAGRIRALQERFDPKLARELPPHVTLVGSSGAGPIEPDTPVEDLGHAVESVTRVAAPLTLTFQPPMRFIDREIVVLPLDPHGPLRALQDAVTASLRKAGIRYATARWPFTPHCTLNYYATLTPVSLNALLAVREAEPWQLHTLRVYHTREGAARKLLFDAPLGG